MITKKLETARKRILAITESVFSWKRIMFHRTIILHSVKNIIFIKNAVIDPGFREWITGMVGEYVTEFFR